MEGRFSGRGMDDFETLDLHRAARVRSHAPEGSEPSLGV